MQSATTTPTPTQTHGKKICGVYAWEHIPTGMLYIGSSVNCGRRQRDHQKKGGHFHRRACELGWNSFTFHIVEECSPEDRLKLERDWIQTMGSIHPNGFNLQRDPTKGWNYTPTDEMREEASARAKITHRTLEYRAAASARAKLDRGTPEARAAAAAMTKLTHGTPEMRAAQSARAKIFNGTPEARAAKSKRQKISHGTPEFRAAQSARMKRILGTPEARAANSRRGKAHYENHPEERMAQSARMKLILGTPEARAAQSARASLQFGTPEARAALSARLKVVLGTPEARAAQSARKKAYYATHKSTLCKAVIQYTLDGAYVNTFESATRAAKTLGVAQSCISKAIKRNGNYGGFRWAFAI